MTTSVIKPIHQRWFAATLSLALPLAACAGHTATTNPTMAGTSASPDAQYMLEEIYASGTPTGFEQMDVSRAVLSHFPPGTPREAIEQGFNRIKSSSTVERTQDTLIVRHNRGRAMLDPDARSVVITFFFDQNNQLRSVEALHIKSQ